MEKNRSLFVFNTRTSVFCKNIRRESLQVLSTCHYHSLCTQPFLSDVNGDFRIIHEVIVNSHSDIAMTRIHRTQHIWESRSGKGLHTLQATPRFVRWTWACFSNLLWWLLMQQIQEICGMRLTTTFPEREFLQNIYCCYDLFVLIHWWLVIPLIHLET